MSIPISSSRPRGIKPRLLVLCGHEPTLDPRIHWAAEKAANEGWDVRVHGFVHGNTKPKFSDPPHYRTTRGKAGDGGHNDRAFGRETIAMGLVPLRFVVAFGLFRFVQMIVDGIYTAVSSIWMLVHGLLSAIGLSRFTTEPLNWILSRVWRGTANVFHGMTGHLMRRLREGLKGYRWYFRVLVLKQAMAAKHHFVGRDWKPDVIHANDPDCLLAAVYLKKLLNCRVVYDAHEYGPEAYLIEATPRSLFFSYERQMLKHIDGAVTVTPQIAGKFQRRYKGKPEFHVVPNATPTPKPDVFQPLDDPFMRVAAGGRLRVIFQGGFAVNRGVEELIDAWKDVDETKAALFIRGPETAYREKLIRHAEQSGRLGSSVFFLPSVAEDDLIRSAINADIGVISYLSKVENHLGACPNKLSQYMQAGLMVVAVNLPFVASVVQSSGAGLVFDDRNPNEFGAALNEAIENEALRRQCRQRAQNYARAIFNYDRFYPVLAALYDGREPARDIPHTRLNDVNQTIIDEPQIGPPIPDVAAFEARFVQSDAQLQLDVSKGVFSARDIVTIAQRLTSIEQTKLTKLRDLSLDISKSLDAEYVETLLQLANESHDKAVNGDTLLFHKAKDGYAEAARLNSAHAAHMLGVMAQLGQGGDVDYQLAAQHYVKAAELDHVVSWRNLGILLQVGGYGLLQDIPQAVEAYGRAAELGDSLSAINGAALLVNETSIKGNEVRAARLLRHALDQQDDRAIDLLARFVRQLGLESYLAVKAN